jgi:hypothetical protein
MFCSGGRRDDHYATPPAGWPDWANLNDCLLWHFFQNHIFKSLFCYFLHKTVVHLDIWTKYGLGYILGDFFLKKSIWSPWPPGPSYLPETNLFFLQVFDEAVRSVLRPQPVRRRTRKCEIFWAKKWDKTSDQAEKVGSGFRSKKMR